MSTRSRLIAGGEMAAGYRIDDNAALHFVAAEPPRVVASRAGATAYRIERASADAVESKLPAPVSVKLENPGRKLTFETNT